MRRRGQEDTGDEGEGEEKSKGVAHRREVIAGDNLRGEENVGGS